MAGDYVSEAATFHDLVHQGWPALVLVAVAIGVQRTLEQGARPSLAMRPWAGLIPAVVYVLAGVVDVVVLGFWQAGARS